MDIEHWRNEIDELDREILHLLNMRARLAMKVGALKRIAGLPLSDPERELRVLNRLAELNPGPLDSGSVTRLFRRIIHESRRIQTTADEPATQEAGLSLRSNKYPAKTAREVQ